MFAGFDIVFFVAVKKKLKEFQAECLIALTNTPLELGL